MSVVDMPVGRTICFVNGLRDTVYAVAANGVKYWEICVVRSGTFKSNQIY